MTMFAANLRLSDPEQALAGLPRPLVVPNALHLIAEHERRTGLRTVVLDDDPTGTQALHDVDLVSRWEQDDITWATHRGPGLSVVLTNSRSLSGAEAARVTGELAHRLELESTRQGWPLRLISRGDSTLRGHVPLEPDVLADVAREHGRPYDAVLFTPAYLEAGRMTVGDVHWVRTDSGWLPAGESEYAHDATFGYRSSNLRDYLEEKSAGRWPAESVVSIDLEMIRTGGPVAVAELLRGITDGQPVIANAASEHDLEVLALAVTLAEGAGRRILHRSGPSFVRLLAGQPRRQPVSGSELYPCGPRSGSGLVVVGSHTANTTRQLARLTALTGVQTVQLDVPALLEGTDEGTAEVARVASLVVAALGTGDVVLQTTRMLSSGPDEASSLVLSNRVSRAITDVVRVVRTRASLRFVIAKGGITSHDVAVTGLGIRRAHLVGQLFDGFVSVLATIDADVDPGLPFVVFPGNVGDEDSLAQAVKLLAAAGGVGEIKI